MSAHTPGPWASPAVLGNIQKYLICRKDDKSGSIFPFATLTAKHGKYKVDWDEMQANARLIAAAPELLEALGEIAEEKAVTDSTTNVKTLWKILEIAKEAITKAHGGIE